MYFIKPIKRLSSMVSTVKPLTIFSFKLQIYDILFLALLLIGFFIRLSFLDYPIFHESGRDYLLGKHIMEYKEFPLVGPTGLNIILKNSPVFWYFIALLLTLQDNILFLLLVGIIFQILTIVIIYLLARRMFGVGTALIASMLFGFSYQSLLYQIKDFWQPWVMQPFISLSYISLLFAYLKGKYYLLLLSLFLLMFSGALYNSAFALVPIFALFAFLILKKHKWGPFHYIGAVGTVIASFVAFYFPVLIYMKGQGFNIKSLFFSEGRYIQNVSEFFVNLGNRIMIVSNEFFFNATESIFSLNNLLFFAVIVCVFLYFFHFQKDSKRRWYAALIVTVIAQPIIFASFLDQPFYNHRFALIFGLLMILIAEAINSVLSKNIILKVGKVALIILLIMVFSGGFSVIHRIYRVSNFYNLRTINSISDVMQTKIFEIQKEEGFEDINFFQIRMYNANYPPQALYSATYWAALERDLRTKFTKLQHVRGDRGFGYEPVNSQEYIFLVCERYNTKRYNNNEECIEIFHARNSSYSLIENIYDQIPFSVYTAKIQGVIK